jgi:hypothetical protein
MKAYNDVNELVQRAVSWEQKLKDLYDVAELGVKDAEAKKIVAMLRDKVAEKLEVLKHVNAAKYGKPEWIQFPPRFSEKGMLPKKAVTRDSKPMDIFNQLLIFEGKLKDFYASILGQLKTENQKDLFQSLVTFKEEQIHEIERIMGKYKPGP